MTQVVAAWELWGLLARALGSVRPSVLLLPGLAACAWRGGMGGGCAAVLELLAYFAGDNDNFHRAAHSLINSSEDVK